MDYKGYVLSRATTGSNYLGSVTYSSMQFLNESKNGMSEKRHMNRMCTDLVDLVLLRKCPAKTGHGVRVNCIVLEGLR